jgi:Spy/CpxP family protein refolding chaperone
MSHVIQLAVAALTICCWSLPAAAQPMGPRGMLGRPAFLDQVFRPEVIMRNQRAINLTTEQRDAITKTMGATQETLVELRWKFEGASQELTEIITPDQVDEKAVLEKARQVMDIEQQIKQEHLLLLVRVKNILTPEQQMKLREIRPNFQDRPGRGRPHAPQDMP